MENLEKCPYCDRQITAEYDTDGEYMVEAECPLCGDVAEELNQEWEEANGQQD